MTRLLTVRHRAGRALLLIFGACTAMTVLLVTSGVAIWVWVIGPALGPHSTSDGSMCSWWSGECASISEEKLASYTGVVIPAGSKILTSHSTAGMKDASAYGLICTGDPGAILSQARAKGFTAGEQSAEATYGRTIPLGTIQSVLIRNTSSSEREQIIVGAACDGHKTRILLTYHWDG